MAIFIHLEFNNIEDIKDYIQRYLYNNLMSKFDDLNNKEIILLKEIEEKNSIEKWKNLKNHTQLDIKSLLRDFNMSNAEMLNLLSLTLIDNKYFDGIIQKEINLKEIEQLNVVKGNKNEKK